MNAAPHPLEFPKDFNPHAVDIWFAACANLPTDRRLAWSTALHNYTEGCERAGLLPLLKDVDINLAIRNYLYKKRHTFVRFLNVTKLMQGRKILRAITREVHVEPYGFSITIEARIREDDPTWYRKLWRLPLGYRFQIQKELGRTVLHLDPGLTVYVRNPMISIPHRWIIGYTIRCPLFPNYDGPLSEDEFILHQLWEPLMNSYRPFKTQPLRWL